MGENLKRQTRHVGPGKRSDLESSAGVIALPIFMAPAFDGAEHRVYNWARLVDEEAGFHGVDNYGWGLESNGVITCVNLPMCQSFSLRSLQNWATLWQLEATARETMVAKQNLVPAHTNLLRRLIVRVQLDMTGYRFIPDPEVWAVEVPLSSQTSVRSGTVGKLVLKSGVKPEVDKERRHLYQARANPARPIKDKDPDRPSRAVQSAYGNLGLDQEDITPGDLKVEEPSRPKTALPEGFPHRVSRQERIRRLKEDKTRLRMGPYTPDMRIDKAEMMVGMTKYGALVYNSQDGFRSEVPNPANPGFSFGNDSELRTNHLSGSFGWDKLALNGKIMNPRAQVVPPSMVDRYPLLMSQPPSIIKGIIRHVIPAVVAVVEKLENFEYKEGKKHVKREGGLEVNVE
jgi:hypothetical protein